MAYGLSVARPHIPPAEPASFGDERNPKRRDRPGALECGRAQHAVPPN